MAKKKESVKVEVVGTNLVVTIPMLNPLKLSKSEKSLVVATTHGNIITEARVNNKPVILGLNAYIKND